MLPLLALIYPLALAQPASAESAWVLWSHYDPDQWSLEAEFFQADGGQLACHRAIADLLQRTDENPRAKQAAELIHLQHTCLPATEDPHVPKGK